ncbi:MULTISPECIES: hypothetical protein [Amycolatopsis]|uniref:Uncharacterized protein n=1 Tax=Amycolatopsis bullii TaxID=941987 RepID=A0ABQ3KSD3_9PSEU|nr:hypothetical protein [Amycolatopsis bullii]GHG50845.1 hypothetical protein GCM10017567_87090 [Amycolatopsis bullii]
MPDEFTPPNDLADQRVPARPGREDPEDTEDVSGVPADTDPADFADQHREAPVLGDGEPWP